MGDKNLKDSLENRKKRMQQGFANMLEIPEDTLLNLPKITMMGNTQVLIENHMGVIEYTPQKLRIGVSFGEIEITGTEFFLKNILSDELSLQGRIESIVFNS
jgi:sporulation protein YqfC